MYPAPDEISDRENVTGGTTPVDATVSVLSVISCHSDNQGRGRGLSFNAWKQKVQATRSNGSARSIARRERSSLAVTTIPARQPPPPKAPPKPKLPPDEQDFRSIVDVMERHGRRVGTAILGKARRRWLERKPRDPNSPYSNRLAAVLANMAAAGVIERRGQHFVPGPRYHDYLGQAVLQT